jgi:hypothetical protein
VIFGIIKKLNGFYIGSIIVIEKLFNDINYLFMDKLVDSYALKVYG